LDNWEQVHIKADKYSGSLRFTLDENEAEDGKYSKFWEGLKELEVQENKRDGFFYAYLMTERKKKNA